MATHTAPRVLAPASAVPGGDPAPMTHRQIMSALSGLLIALFVAILSSTIVSNALPTILGDIGGGESAYTWVVTASLLAVTATTPIWGKLSDLFSKKLLVQLALVCYIAGSVVAGFSTGPGMLIACRLVQGVGAGGLAALAQVIMAAMISPRQRGRYSGYLGAAYALGTVGGPLIGGVIVDSALGWRWCFYVGVPFAVVAIVVLQKTLDLPVVRREVKIDWTGAFFITAAVSLLMVWVSLGGQDYAWLSWQTAVMLPGSALLTALFVFTESRAAQPIVPLRLFRNKTITLTSVASLFVGVSMFSATVFISEYFQLARGKSATMSGVLTIPLIAGLFAASMGSGRIITRTGRWKGFLVAGGLLLAAGSGLLGTIRVGTPYAETAGYMALLGLGVGMMMQNLVLAVQNQVSAAELGAAGSLVTFFRSLGGAIGVTALGAVLGNRVSHYTAGGLADLHVTGATGDPGGIPELGALPGPVRGVVESAYGHGVADVFLYAAPLAFVSFLLVVFIKEVPLKNRSGLQQAAAAAARTSARTSAHAVTQAVAREAEAARPAGAKE